MSIFILFQFAQLIVPYHPDLKELTPAVLRDLVNTMYVCAPGKSGGHRVQDVKIGPDCIGFLPQSILSEMVTHAAKSRTA